MVAVNLRATYYWLDHLFGTTMHWMQLALLFFSSGWGRAKLEMLEQISK
jgi:hypothetical protein